MGERLATMFPLNRYQEAHNAIWRCTQNLGWVGWALLAAVICDRVRNVLAAYSQDRTLGRSRSLICDRVIYSLTEAGFRMMSASMAWISSRDNLPFP